MFGTELVCWEGLLKGVKLTFERRKLWRKYEKLWSFESKQTRSESKQTTRALRRCRRLFLPLKRRKTSLSWKRQSDLKIFSIKTNKQQTTFSLFSLFCYCFSSNFSHVFVLFCSISLILIVIFLTIVISSIQSTALPSTSIHSFESGFSSSFLSSLFFSSIHRSYLQVSFDSNISCCIN